AVRRRGRGGAAAGERARGRDVRLWVIAWVWAEQRAARSRAQWAGAGAGAARVQSRSRSRAAVDCRAAVSARPFAATKRGALCARAERPLRVGGGDRRVLDRRASVGSDSRVTCERAERCRFE